MRRTTSLSELSPSPCAHAPPPSRPPSSEENRSKAIPPAPKRKSVKRRYSADLSSANVAHFLDACGLCKRSISPGIDTFMYRGEVAFCSKECRDQRIREDGRKKRSSSSMKKANPLPPIQSSESST